MFVGVLTIRKVFVSLHHRTTTKIKIMNSNTTTPATLENLSTIVKTGYASYGHVIKRSNLTSTVVEITGYNREPQRIKNKYISDHGLVPLTKENAKTASSIININNPQWGTKTFTFDAGGNHSHTFGQALLFEDEFRFWLVATTK